MGRTHGAIMVIEYAYATGEKNRNEIMKLFNGQYQDDFIMRNSKENREIRSGRHCVFNMHIHLVFITKYRKCVFTKQILEDLRDVFQSVCTDFESELVDFNGERDHVHLLVHYPPKVSVSKLVNSLKGVSSRMIRRKNHPSISQSLWVGSLWSPSYFAGSCGGAPIEIIRKYIEDQATPS